MQWLFDVEKAAYIMSALAHLILLDISLEEYFLSFIRWCI